MKMRYLDKYRIPSARLIGYNYAQEGAYFITICTLNRKHFFGAVINETMHLSEIGKIVETEWNKTPGMRPDMNLGLGEYVIMPNHFHAIIIIGNNSYNTNIQTIANQFGPQRKNLASIVRGFKSSVTTRARCLNPGFAWQSRYHESIIRNGRAFENISRYIRRNPMQWNKSARV